MSRAIDRRQFNVSGMILGILGLGFIYHFPSIYISACEFVGQLGGQYITFFINSYTSQL